MLKGGRGAVLENGNGVKNDEKVVLESGNGVKNDEKAVLENENKVRTRSEEMKDKENALALPVALLSLALIIVNVVLLFGRHLVANLVATMVLTALTAWLLRSRREAGTPGVEAAKQRVASKDASSQNAAKQEVSSREASSQEAAKQEVYNREASLQEAAQQEVYNQNVLQSRHLPRFISGSVCRRQEPICCC